MQYLLQSALVCATLCLALRASAERVAVPVDPDKPYIHEPTGFVFPPELGPFTRVDVTRYDQKGFDVSAGYNNVSQLIAATVYIYPTRGQDIAVHMTTLEQNVLRAHAAARLTKQGEWSLTQHGKQYTGLAAAFGYVEDFAGARREVRSEACLLRLGSNFVLYRITYPADSERQMAAHAINDFQSKLTLPSPPRAAVGRRQADSAP